MDKKQYEKQNNDSIPQYEDEENVTTEKISSNAIRKSSEVNWNIWIIHDIEIAKVYNIMIC